MIIKCKMCGGDLEITEGLSVAECEYCGSKQTIPSADNEKKMTLFNRASRLLRGCEFDKAAGVFESIIADFPEEAEAYWGLVLCKYGIEYVDDPGTGKKVPTCHRSSFDSVLDDSNFEQACEFNDAIARRLYRDEARQIEELRKRIIEVSGAEEAYDVFISYKETGADGERTLDSVLAQDIYKELTKEGYRVFFSRISLENKLGVEYEPYIFAALNSAKVMLVVGTDYDHFDAVWVKNEWSRFLKLIESGQKKVLIPVFKNMDAYDMPKEFNKLAALDMGKLGAMQDLLHGVEKIIPKEPVVIRESIVLQTGDSKLFALLDRGNMAIEDGDWEKADSFFEDVLNHDSKNAEAYLGKTLAQEKCRTPDALVRKRIALYKDANYETLYIPEAKDHIAQVVEQYAIKYYLSRDTISHLYDSDLSYLSKLPACKKQLESEKNWWANHKTLSKAEKFATGDVAKSINEAKNTLFSFMNERIDSAEKAESEARAAVEASYAEHIAKADKLVESRGKDALDSRENDYLAFAAALKQENEPKKLLSAAESLEKLNDYKDSAELAKLCRKKAAEIEAENARIAAEEAEKRRVADAKAREAKKRKIKRNLIIAAIICVFAVAAFVVFGVPVMEQKELEAKYNAAEELLAAGEYAEAADAFSKISEFEDAVEKSEEALAAEEELKHRLIKTEYKGYTITNNTDHKQTTHTFIDYTYNENGQLIREERADGVKLVEYEYDENGLLAKTITSYFNKGSQIPREVVTTEHDMYENFISYVTEYPSSGQKANIPDYTLTFADDGHLEKRVLNHEYGKTIWEYGEDGKLIAETIDDSRANIGRYGYSRMEYVYDEYGNVQGRNYFDKNGEQYLSETYENSYDNEGHLVKQVRDNSYYEDCYEYKYDEIGNKVYYSYKTNGLLLIEEWYYYG